MGQTLATIALEMVRRFSSRGHLAARQQRVPDAPSDPFDAPQKSPDDSSLLQLLDEIENAAFSVYAANGLPTEKGQYAWSKRRKSWKFLADKLTAEERWALVLANSGKADWRFGSLDDLGREHPEATSSTREASQLLTACHAIRSVIENGVGCAPADSLERAIRLGWDWRATTMTAPADKAKPGRREIQQKARSSRSKRPTASTK